MDEEEPISKEDLDTLMAGTEDPEPVGSIMDGESLDNDEDSSPMSPEDLPDPDPLPEALTSPQELGDTGEKGGALKYILIAFLLILAGSGAGLYYGRDQIVSFWPASENYFAMVGLPGESLGAGLKIKDIKPEWSTENGQDILDVRGRIVNISDEVQDIPMIRVVLFNTEGKEVQSATVTPRVKQVPAGKKVGFSAKLINPPESVRNISVVFTKEKPAPAK